MSATRPATSLDRDHAEVRLPRGDRGQRVLEGRAGQGLRVGIGLGDGDVELAPVRPGMRFSCCCRWFDHARVVAGAQLFASIRRAVSRSAGVSTPRGTVSTIMTSIRMPASSAAAARASPAVPASRGEADETLQRRPAIGIEADVMIARSVAPGRRGAGEVERAQRRGPIGEPTALTTFGFRLSSSVWISAPASRYRPRGRPAARARC